MKRKNANSNWNGFHWNHYEPYHLQSTSNALGGVSVERDTASQPTPPPPSSGG